MNYSSAPGPKVPIRFGEHIMHSMCVALPSVGGNCLGFSAMSMGNILKIVMTTDQFGIDDPDLFMSIYTRRVREFMGKSSGDKLK